MTQSPPRPAPPMPRWVKLFVVVGLVVGVLFIGSALAGVQHGPSMHTTPSGPASSMP